MPKFLTILLFASLIAPAALARQDRPILHPAPRTKPVPIDPAIAARLPDAVKRVHLADNAAGMLVEDINGHGRPLTFRNGMMLVINGTGFSSQKPKSNVSLFEGARTTGVPLKIWDWSDTRIAAEIPLGQTLIAHDALARLVIWPVTDANTMERLEITGIHFVAPVH